MITINTYLVTGGTGFVGEEVVRQLLADGEAVIVIGRRRSYNNGADYVQADILDPQEVESKLKYKDIDYILHLASLPSDTGNPRQMVDVNVNGCLTMLELARKRQVKRMVVASSISAYEWYPGTQFRKPDYMPVDELHPCRPRDMYSSTKRMQELLTTTYFHEFHVPVTCLRLSAVIGPNGKGGGRGWREIAEELLRGEIVHLPHFSADEICHYVDIRDVARMVRTVAVNDKADGEIFNCCGPDSITGKAFAGIVEKLFPGIQVEFGYPWSMAQGGEISFSMEKAKQILSFVPKYTVEDSMRLIQHWLAAGGLENPLKTMEQFEKGITKV